MTTILPKSCYADLKLVLEIPGPWQVTRACQDTATGLQEVHLECPPDTRWIAGEDDPTELPVDHYEIRRWRHQQPGFTIILRAQVPWLRHADGHVAPISIPWDNKLSRHCLIFVAEQES